MQSLTQNHQRRFFVVQGSSGLDIPLEVGQLDTLHANADRVYSISDLQALSSLLEDQCTTSQLDWKQLYNRLLLHDAQDSDPGAPWLNRTGISCWIGRFQLDKKELQGYVEPLGIY